jgi:hypothetical protein
MAQKTPAARGLQKKFAQPLCEIQNAESTPTQVSVAEMALPSPKVYA